MGDVREAIRENIGETLTITPEARATVLDVLAKEPDSESLALWLEVSGEVERRLVLRHVLPGARRRHAATTSSKPTTTFPWSSPPPAWTGCGGRRSISPPTPPAKAGSSSSTPTRRHPELSRLRHRTHRSSTSRTRWSNRSWPCSTNRSIRASPPTVGVPIWWRSKTPRSTCA